MPGNLRIDTVHRAAVDEAHRSANAIRQVGIVDDDITRSRSPAAQCLCFRRDDLERRIALLTQHQVIELGGDVWFLGRHRLDYLSQVINAKAHHNQQHQQLSSGLEYFSR